MDKFEKGVPFDPGYSSIAVSFIGNIPYLTQEYSNLKTPHQKKFKLTMIEKPIIELINKCTAFYLGCMLWGGFIHCRFKDDSKQILDNNTNGLSENELKELDCAKESNFMLEFIKQFDRDCKYYLKKPLKIAPQITEILTNYDEFVKLNNNFVGISATADVKLPKAAAHFENLTDEELDSLHIKIMNVISSGKIEDLLKIGFYNPKNQNSKS